MEDKRYMTLHEIVQQAREKLDATYWDYLVGGADTETTLRRNRLALDQLGIVSRVLNDVSAVDTSGSLLGHQLDMPVLLAPIGSLESFDPGGGASAAIAADHAGIISMASSVCQPSLEAIASASAGPKIYQLYVRGDVNWISDVIQRALDNDYAAFCLTVDTAVVSRRERDIAKRVSPTSAQPAGGMEYQASFSWHELAEVRARHNIPLIIKGISHPADARRAVDLGVNAIYVSNHGGRQLDQAIASISALPAIVEAVQGEAEIIVDGGFYRGTDILKAIALGANCVGIGRLEAWALAAGGVPALLRCLTLLKRELTKSMALAGVTTLADLNPAFVTQAAAVATPDVVSAFPLIDDYPGPPGTREGIREGTKEGNNE